jgi:ABC-type branched-subunit amino acid transport system substrate-binding protein
MCVAAAEKRYDPGASDTEIRIGAVVPLSGWAKDYGAVARAEAAYFQMVNERGGVNGRKINFSNARSKGWLRASSRGDPAVREFVDWMARYNPQASLRDQNNVAGYERAQALVAVLAQCGDDLTRANLMAQAAHLDLDIGMLRPGIRVKTSPTDYQPIKQLFLIRFDGTDWQAEGVVGGV